MRVMFAIVAATFVALFAPSQLTKERILVFVVGMLTSIGLVRVLAHETKCAAKEIFPSLTEIAEGYYAFRSRFAELRSRSKRNRHV
jgi:hypothetical protein